MVKLILIGLLIFNGSSFGAVTVFPAHTPPSLDVFRPYGGGWNGPRMFGWQFRTTHAIGVTSLGHFDYFGDGLQAEHPIGLWDSRTQELLATAIVGGETQGVLEGGYRYVDLAEDLMLAPGYYLIASLGGSDPDGWPSGIRNTVFSESISYVGTWLTLTNGMFEFPPISITNSTGPADGSNFRYFVVPEPGVTTMSCLALLILSHLASRRRSSNVARE